MSASVAPPWTGRTAWRVALGLAVVAAAVRIGLRVDRPMWLDEAVSIGLARAPLDQLWGAVTGIEVNGGAFHLLLHALQPALSAFDFDELSGARALAGLLGVSTVPALYLVARRPAGDAAALIAALLLAVHRFHVRFSMEARGYTLALFLVVLATGAWLSALERPRVASVLVWVALLWLATWAHLFAALVAAAQALAALAHPAVRGERGPEVARRARMALAAGLVLLAASAGPLVLLAASHDAGQVGWIPPLSAGRVGSVLVALLGGVRPLMLPALAGLLLAAAALRRHRDGPFGAALEAAWFLVPLVLTVLISAVKPLLVARYLLVALPGLLLLCARAITALPRPWVVPAAALFALLGLHRSFVDPWSEPPWQPLDRAAAHVAAVTRPGDALVVSHGALAISLSRELRRLPARPTLDQVEPPPRDPLELGPDHPLPLEERLRAHAGAVFLLFAEQPPSAAARRALGRDWRASSDEWFGELRVLRLEPAGAPPR